MKQCSNTKFYNLCRQEAKIVAINEPSLSLDEIVQMIKYDSNYGPWPGQVEVKSGNKSSVIQYFSVFR